MKDSAKYPHELISDNWAAILIAIFVAAIVMYIGMIVVTTLMLPVNYNPDLHEYRVVDTSVIGLGFAPIAPIILGIVILLYCISKMIIID